MPRTFNGTSDRLVLSVGAQAGTDGGPVTIGGIFYVAVQQSAGVVCVRTATPTPKYGVNPFSDGNCYYSTDDGVVGFGSTSCPTGEWVLILFTKGNGSAQARAHKYLYNSTSWSHADVGSPFGDSATGAADAVQLGCYTNNASGEVALNGDLAVAGIWNRVLTDQEVETLPFRLSAWKGSGPSGLWAMNQPATTDPVTDLTGNGANQTSLTGTAVSSNEVPGFSYVDDEQRQTAFRYGMLRDWRLVYG